MLTQFTVGRHVLLHERYAPYRANSLIAASSVSSKRHFVVANFALRI